MLNIYSNHLICFLSDNAGGSCTNHVSEARNGFIPEGDITNQQDTSRSSGNFPGIFGKTIVNKVRRRMYWEMFEIDKNNYRSFKEFKQNWDPNLSIRKEIKNEIRADYEKFKRAKNTIVWLLNRRKSRRPRW